MIFPVEREALSLLIAIAAVATMLTGVLGAIAQNDIRRAMGFLVISGIGVMLAGLSIGNPSAFAGAIFYGVHSMVVMTALYFAAGLGARYGGFHLTGAGGIYVRNVALAGMTLMLFLSVAGLPPFSGFWPKAMLVKASIDIGAWWLAAAILVTGGLTAIAVGRIFALAYWRPAPAPDGEAMPVETVRLPVGSIPILAALTALTMLAGLWPEPLIVLANTAAAGLADPAAYIQSVFPVGVPR